MQTTGDVAAALARLEAAGLVSRIAALGSVILSGVETVVVSIPLASPASTTRLVDDALDGIAHQCVLGDYPMPMPDTGRVQPVEKDNRSWRVGGQSEVSWIRDHTTPGLAITSAIPPVFDAYVTVVIPDDDAKRLTGESALLRVLKEHTPAQPWWLGYLDSGAHDVVFDDAWKILLYSGWSYVLVEAGPSQAGSWRADDPWRGRLPDLIFPADRNWLVSLLWDDDWRCLGGPSELIEAVLAEPALDTRTVSVDDDATPPGHTAR